VKRPMRPEDLLRFRWPGDVAISPDGRVVAYVENRIEASDNAYRSRIMAVSPGEAPRPLTGGEADRHPRWSPDGRWLGFIAKRGAFSQVWLLPAGGGEARPVTSWRGGVGGFEWSPDAGRIAVLAHLDGRGLVHAGADAGDDDDAVPAGDGVGKAGADAGAAPALGGLDGDAEGLERLYRKYNRDVKVTDETYYKLDGEGFFTARRGHVVVVDVARALAADGDLTGAARQITHGPYHDQEVVWAADGRSLFVTSRYGDDYDRHGFHTSVYRVAAAGGEPVAVTPTEDESAAGVAVRPDGGAFAYESEAWLKNGYDNALIRVRDGAPGPARTLAAALDRPVGLQLAVDMIGHGQTGLRYAPDGNTLYTVVSDGGRSYLAAVDAASGAVRPVTGGDRCVFAYSIDGAGRRAAVAIATPTAPGDVFLVDLLTGTEERLTEINAGLFAEVEIVAPERFTATSADGTKVDAWVMRPVGFEPGRTYPTALEIHGGPMSMYGQGFFFEFQVLAAAGYGVVYGNPRGSKGYGEAFCSAIKDRWGDLDYQDVIATIDTAVRENGWIDPDRLGVLGGSYGGYMTNWIVGHTDRFKAAVTMRSVVDWASMMGTDDIGSDWYWRAGGKPPWAQDDWYRQQSPLTYVENVVTPILIEHQEGDLRCPIGQGEELYVALRWLGKAPTRFVRYPNEFHGMSRNGQPFHRVHRLRQVLDWFGQYLGVQRPALTVVDRTYRDRAVSAG